MVAKKLALAAMAAATLFGAAPAAAVQQVFAQFELLETSRNFVWSRVSGNNYNLFTTGTGGSSASADIVRFSLVGSPIPLVTNAAFLLSGSGSDSLPGSTGAFSQNVDNFTFNFVATENFCWYGSNCFSIGDVLLSGSVANATLTGVRGATASDGQLAGSTLTSTVTFSSPLLTFQPTTELSFLFDLASTDRRFQGGPTNALGSFRSQITGQFLADETVAFNVPEPATWAMMIIGMGLVGVARRRRRTVVTA